MRPVHCAIIIFCLHLPALAQNPVEGRRLEFVTAFNKGDAASLERICEPKCLLLTFGGQVVQGGPMIAKGMASMSSQMDLDLKPIQMRQSQDMIYEAGTWSHFKKGTKQVKQQGTFVWIWKKEKDDWRLETLSVTAAPGAPIETGQ